VVAACLWAGAEPAHAGALLPERGGSPNADRIASLYTVVLILAGLVFAGVTIALAYALWRYRERRSPVAAQVHGNTRLEIGWTLAATALIIFIAVFSLSKLSAIEDPDTAAATPAAVQAGIVAPGEDKALHIEVVGMQYIWLYRYPGGAYSYGEMVAPTGVTVKLDIVSQDVAHSWWIPKLGGKFDAIPGYTNHTWFRISKTGVYRGQCAELCGRNHANMLAQVRAVPPDQYVAWIQRQKRLLAAAEADRKRDASTFESQQGGR
jgi:cytochrome c oxidase subunit 2